MKKLALFFWLIPFLSFGAARSVQVIVDNFSDLTFKFLNISASHGIISQNPPSQISAQANGMHMVASFMGESAGIMTGTEGGCKFSIYQGGTRATGNLEIFWNLPFSGNISFHVNAPPGVFYSFSGGSGSNAIVRIYITRTANLSLNQPITLVHEPIQYIKLRVKTANTGMAGTDNEVFFSIGPISWHLNSLANYNVFEQGAINEFILPITVALYLDDIMFFKLEKKGVGGWRNSPIPNLDGDWEVEFIELEVNSRIIRKDVGTILSGPTPDWIEEVQNYTVNDPATRFLSSLSLVGFPPISRNDQWVAASTTKAKIAGVSGWIEANLGNVGVCGRVVSQPVLSSDGFITIDIEVFRLLINNFSFLYYQGRKRYIRVEFIAKPGGYTGITDVSTLDTDMADYISRGIVPRIGEYTEFMGKAMFDSDNGGWNEIHLNWIPKDGQNYSPFFPVPITWVADFTFSLNEARNLLWGLATQSSLSFSTDFWEQISKISHHLSTFYWPGHVSDPLNMISELELISYDIDDYYAMLYNPENELLNEDELNRLNAYLKEMAENITLRIYQQISVYNGYIGARAFD